MKDCDYFEINSFGTQVRLYLGEPLSASNPPNSVVVAHIEAYLKMFERRLSRFRADSELCRLNDSPEHEVAASSLLRRCTRAALDVATFSEGLVDPTVIDYLERAGYRESRAESKPASIHEALADAPERAPASPAPGSLWRQVEIDDSAGVIRRKPGIRLDFGGIGKGLAADSVAYKLKGLRRALIDCGGDIRAVQNCPDAEPFEVQVENPLTGETSTKFLLNNAGIATSGIVTRIWKTASGYAHHLIDPSTGNPAWTGVVQSTAMASTALEAETVSKIALLSGPQRARGLIERFGGEMIQEDGCSKCFYPA